MIEWLTSLYLLLFTGVRGETVRKVPVVPGKRPHRVPKARRSARFDRGIRAKYTRAASIEPLFGQFQKVNSPKFVLTAF
jgi:hypothetical protein